MSAPDPELPFTLGFLALSTFEGAVVRGGLLLTDRRTKPLEFRVTDPVQPDPLQRTLYGVTFEEHVGADVVGAPLLAAATHIPKVVIVREMRLLAMRPAAPCPVLCIGKEHEMIAATRRDTPSFLLAAPDPRQASLVILGDPGDADVLPDLALTLQGIYSHHALLEPFDRLAAALQHVHGARTV